MFSVHGVWALGVRLMRNVNFATKALLISFLFCFPLVWLNYYYFTKAAADIDFTSKERQGVEYLRELYPVLDLAQQMRRDAAAAAGGGAATVLAETREKLRAAQGKLAAVDARLGGAFSTKEQFSLVGQAFATAEQATGVEQIFSTHTKHVQEIMELITVVADHSNLTLDPDTTSYYLMDAGVGRLPYVVENAGKLRGLGAVVLRSGSITPAQQRTLSEMIPIAEFQFRGLEKGLNTVFRESPELKSKLDTALAVADTAAFFKLARETVIDKQEFGDPAAADILVAAGNKAISEQYALGVRLMDALDAELTTRLDRMHGQMTTVLVVQALSVLLAAYFFFAFYLVTRGGLAVISRHLQEMAQGDLQRAPFKPWGRDEPAAVITDLRQTYVALHNLINKVRHSSSALHEASGEIAAASSDLGARTERAAAALEQQAAAMEEIGATVGATATGARQAADFAAKNAQVAQQGSRVFAEVVNTMHGIQTSSSKIADIISVIDGIAFQTNILALNAAVEAARAGEQGRGFAVVASEVRSLAQRSADAAKEIKTLINTSVEQVTGGTHVVEAAGESMREVVSNAQKISGLLSEIDTSSQQQASAVEQVVKAVQDLDRNTQQNAALVEETTAAAASLTQQADLLQAEISNFKT